MEHSNHKNSIRKSSTDKTSTFTEGVMKSERLYQDLVFSKVDEESKNSPEETIPELMTRKALENPDFCIFKSKSQPKGVFDLCVTIREYLELTRTAARSFIKLGLDRNCAVGILGFNHAVWCISQFGCIFAGGLSCGIYTTNSAETCRYIINDCSCQIMVVENPAQMTKILSIAEQCSQLKAIIQYTGEISEEHKNGSTLPLYTWSEFLELSSLDENEILESRVQSMKPRDVALLFYTSGTTGMPKGVMVSHDNILWACKMALYAPKTDQYCNSMISYLPLSHVAANMVDVIAPITFGATIYFAQPDALKGSLGITLKEVRPTIFLGVPRVFEKIQEQIQEIALKSNKFKKLIGAWAKAVGFKNNMKKQSGKSTDFMYDVAKRLVFDKVKKALGLNRCHYVLSGAAPMTQQTLDFFLSLDILIHQVYGMTETSGPHAIGHVDRVKIGTAGNMIRGAETKIVNPDEDGIGELCLRGRHVFLGYFNDEEKTKEVFDEDGWFHSGDLGMMVDNEFLKITGRLKELIITAGGENIAPLPIEDNIRECLPFVSNAVLIGDQRKFISCLLTLKTIIDPDTLAPTSKLTPAAIHSLGKIGIQVTEVQEVIECKEPILKTTIDEAIQEVNKRSISRAAFVQKWSILPKEFSVAGGELGPTMKLKRSFITEMYAEVIDKMYAQ